jgi:hypothetical protein
MMVQIMVMMTTMMLQIRSGKFHMILVVVELQFKSKGQIMVNRILAMRWKMFKKPVKSSRRFKKVWCYKKKKKTIANLQKKSAAKSAANPPDNLDVSSKPDDPSKPDVTSGTGPLYKYLRYETLTTKMCQVTDNMWIRDEDISGELDVYNKPDVTNMTEASNVDSLCQRKIRLEGQRQHSTRPPDRPLPVQPVTVQQDDVIKQHDGHTVEEYCDEIKDSSGDRGDKETYTSSCGWWRAAVGCSIRTPGCSMTETPGGLWPTLICLPWVRRKCSKSCQFGSLTKKISS